MSWVVISCKRGKGIQTEATATQSAEGAQQRVRSHHEKPPRGLDLRFSHCKMGVIPPLLPPLQGPEKRLWALPHPCQTLPGPVQPQGPQRQISLDTKVGSLVPPA